MNTRPPGPDDKLDQTDEYRALYNSSYEQRHGSLMHVPELTFAAMKKLEGLSFRMADLFRTLFIISPEHDFPQRNALKELIISSGIRGDDIFIAHKSIDVEEGERDQLLLITHGCMVQYSCENGVMPRIRSLDNGIGLTFTHDISAQQLQFLTYLFEAQGVAKKAVYELYPNSNDYKLWQQHKEVLQPQKPDDCAQIIRPKVFQNVPRYVVGAKAYIPRPWGQGPRLTMCYKDFQSKLMDICNALEAALTTINRFIVEPEKKF